MNMPNLIDLNVLAKCAGISVDLLREMNPELIQYCTPPNYEGGYSLKIPSKSRDIIEQNLQNVPDEAKLQYVLHTVKSSETLSGIASKYGVRVGNLAEFNSLTVRSPIYPGKELKIPISTFTEEDLAINSDILPAIEEEFNGKDSTASYQLKISINDDQDKYLKLYKQKYNDLNELSEILRKKAISIKKKNEKLKKQIFITHTGRIQNLK